MANSGKKFTSKPEIEESKLEIEKKDSNYFELGDNELLNLNLIGGFYPDKTKSEEPFDPKYTDTFYPASTNISSDSSSSSEESKDKPTHTTPVEGSFVEIDDVSQLPQNIALGNYYPQKPKPLKKSLIADLTGEVDDDDLFKSPIEEEKKEVKRISEKKELSTGLEKLHDAPLPPIGKKERFFPGTVLGSRMYVGDKPGGMEPGVLLVKINYSLIQRLDKENVIDAAEFLKKWENKISNSDDACVDFLKEEMAKIHQHVDVRYLTEQTQRDANHKEITLQLAKFKKKVSTTPTFTQTFSPVKLEQDFPEDKAEEEISEDKDGEFTLVDKAEKTGTTDPITLKLAKLDHVIKTINKEARGGSIPLSLIKQYYNDTLYNRPSPPYYRMKNTHRGQKSSAMYVKIWKFSKAIKTSREHENKNAISEVFATAIARAHAMPAQNQYILVGSYETGKLMITTDADWETRFRPIEKNFAGQLNDKDYANNCYVQKDKPIVKVSFPIYQAALDTFQCAAQNLVLMLIQADDDGLGSQLQNKGRLTSGNVTEFYGIDFGHAYREENDLISDLTLDFTLSNGKLKKYKNFSILFDSPPTDKMLGLFYAYQALSEQSKIAIMTVEERKNIERAIEAYAERYPHFKEKMSMIQSGCVDELTKKYEKELNGKIIALQEDLEEASPDEKSNILSNIAELQSLIGVIKSQGEKHIKSSRELIKKFKDRMQHEPFMLELLVNLAKLTSVTSITSGIETTGEVELKHLKIHHSPNKNQVIWHCEHNVKKDTICFSTKLPKDQDFKEVSMVLKEYFAERKIVYPIIEMTTTTEKEIRFIVPKKEAQTFAQELSEDNIKKLKPEITVNLQKEFSPAFALSERLSLLTSLTDKKLQPILDKDRFLTKWSHERLPNGNILFYGIPNDNNILPKRDLLVPLIEHFTRQIKGNKISVEVNSQKKNSLIEKLTYKHSQIEFTVTPKELALLQSAMTDDAILIQKNKPHDLQDRLLTLDTTPEIYNTMKELADKLVRLTSLTDEGLSLHDDKDKEKYDKFLTQWEFKKLANGQFLFYGIPKDNNTLRKRDLSKLLEPFASSVTPAVTIEIKKQGKHTKHQQLQMTLSPEQAAELLEKLDPEAIVAAKGESSISHKLIRHSTEEADPTQSEENRNKFFSGRPSIVNVSNLRKLTT